MRHFVKMGKLMVKSSLFKRVPSYFLTKSTERHKDRWVYRSFNLTREINLTREFVWNMIIQQRVACSVIYPCASFSFPIRYLL